MDTRACQLLPQDTKSKQNSHRIKKNNFEARVDPNLQNLRQYAPSG